MAQRNREPSLKPSKTRQALTLIDPIAAGIDIGSASHYVVVPPDRDDEPVREFAQLHRRSSSPGRLARGLRRGHRGDGIHRCVLLAAFKDLRIKASVDEIAKNLQGNWRAEHLFALKQALGAFDFIGMQLAEGDRRSIDHALAWT